MWYWTTKPVLSVNFSKLRSIDVWFLKIGQYLAMIQLFKKSRIWGCKKMDFKVVQIMFLEMHITNRKLRFYIFMEINLQNIFMGTWSLLNILMIFGIKEKSNR